MKKIFYKIILIILVFIFLVFYVSIFMIKEKRAKEMCQSFKESTGLEGCTLEYYEINQKKNN